MNNNKPEVVIHLVGLEASMVVVDSEDSKVLEVKVDNDKVEISEAIFLKNLKSSLVAMAVLVVVKDLEAVVEAEKLSVERTLHFN